MADATYRCERCGIEADFDVANGELFDGPCVKECPKRKTVWKRLWTRLRIGAVRGAGGSPSR